MSTAVSPAATASQPPLSDALREALRYPKLRPDLIVSRQQRQYGNRFTIKVPDTERYFQLGEDEFAIMQLMDGQRSLSALLATIESDCHLEVDARTLWTFVKLLHKSGCLELPDDIDDTQKAAKKHKNPLRNALYLDRHVFNPDPLLSYLEPRLRFFFSQSFLWLAATVLLVGLSIVTAHSERVIFELSSLGSVSGFLSLYLAAAGVTVLHEFAHGLTCKHYGGKVPSMGMLLILLTFPCFYTDVSDAWLLEKKRQRIAVTAAGVVFESVIWSLATMLWLVTAPDALIHQLCLGVMISSGAGMLLSLNPLIKFDGYYLISDALDIPNLRNKAMAYFSIWLGSLLSGRRDGLPKVTRRDHRVFVIYGLAVIAFTFFILGSVVYMLSAYAVDQFGLLFLLPVAFLFWMLLGSTIKGIWNGMSVANTQEQPTAKGVAPINNTVTPLTPVPEPAQSSIPEPDNTGHKSTEDKPPRRYTRPLLLVLIITAVVGSHFVSGPLEIGGHARLKPVAAQSVEPSIQGLIKDVYVQEGARVEAGQALLKIDDESLLAELKSAEADLLSARKELVLLENGTRPETLAAQRAQLTILQADVVYNREHFERLSQLPNSVSKTQRLEAKHLWESAIKKVQVARNELDLLEAGTALEEIEAKRASITALEVKTQTLEQDLKNTILHAPISGIVVTREPERLIGKFTSQGSAVLDIEKTGAFKAQISVQERDVAELALGQPVRLKVYSYPGREFAGKVTHIASTVDMALVNSLETSVILVDAAIDDPGQVLKSGMNGLARITGEEYTWLELALRKVTHWFKIEFWL